MWMQISRNSDRYVVKEMPDRHCYCIYDTWYKDYLIAFYPTYEAACRMCRKLNDGALILRRKHRR